MKERLSAGLLAILMFVCTFSARAETVKKDERSPSNDIVIVLDQSRSMNGDRQKADPEGYRLDAAQMIVGMCDMHSSRVAFIPFAGTIQKSADKDFVNINEARARLEKMKRIESMREEGLASDTDLGNALSRAVMLLLQREDKSNAPMIIVLTDGANSLSTVDKKSDVYLWNESTNTYSVTTVFAYGTDNDNRKNNVSINRVVNATTQQDDAVKAAKHNNIPIYTIALTQIMQPSTGREDESEDVRRRKAEIKRYTGDLRAIADLTNGQYIELDSTKADTLPRMFGEMFATQIGSLLVKEFTPAPINGQDGEYEVLLPILNKSVLEANIFIPTKNIDAGSITLYDAGGKDCSRGAQDVVVLESSRFLLYKIQSPRKLGDWRLVFRLKNKASSLSDISLNLLYNYNVTFKTRVGTGISNLNAPHEGISLGKNDHLYITSSFYQHDEKSGEEILSTDENLYKTQDGAEWKTIRATYSLINENGSVVLSGELPTDGFKAFTCDIDLSQVTSPEGNNRLRGGMYSLEIKADGAGLQRVNTIPVEIHNEKPAQKSGSLYKRIVVNDPSQEVTMNVQTDQPLDIREYIHDPDNDQVTYEFRSQDGADSIIRVKTVKDANGRDSVVYETIMDTNGHLRYGKALYTVTATDIPDGESSTFTFVFDVFSQADSVLNDFQCQPTSKGIDDGIAQKNSIITFEMSLLSRNGAPDTSGIIKDFKGHVGIYDAQNMSRQLDMLEMTLNDDGTRLVVDYTTGNTAGKYMAICQYSYGMNWVPDIEIPFEVLNKQPAVSRDAADALLKRISFNPLPGFLSFIEQPTPANELNVDISKLFVDEDNEKGLVFNASIAPTGAAGDSTDILKVVPTPEGNSVELIPKRFGNVALRFSATDGDGQSTSITVAMSIVDIQLQWLVIAIGVVTLILILLIIHLIRRPRFASGTTLHVYVNAALQADEICYIPHKQGALTLRKYIPEECAMRGGVTAGDLERLSIRPTRRSGGSVVLQYTNKKHALSSLCVQLTGVELDSGSVVWNPETEIMIKHSADASDCLRVTLECEHASSINSHTSFVSKSAASQDVFATDDGAAKTSSNDIDW